MFCSWDSSIFPSVVVACLSLLQDSFSLCEHAIVCPSLCLSIYRSVCYLFIFFMAGNLYYFQVFIITNRNNIKFSYLSLISPYLHISVGSIPKSESLYHRVYIHSTLIDINSQLFKIILSVYISLLVYERSCSCCVYSNPQTVTWHRYYFIFISFYLFILFLNYSWH